MTVASIVIPIADYHVDVSARAIASAREQTVPCEVIPVHDGEGRGAGAARNLGAAQATAPFVVFLDADDVLEPTFVEQCVMAYQQGRYVYTGWHERDEERYPRPCNPYKDGGYHLVTTLYPTQAFLRLGGFDEKLPGYEDTAFYLKSENAGICGVGLQMPLLWYTDDGERGLAFTNNPRRYQIMSQVNSQYRELNMCCGQPHSITTVAGEQQPGDVLAVARYAAMRKIGTVSGRVYERNHFGIGQQMWVSPEDVRAHPELWEAVPDVASLTPPVDEVMTLAGLK